MSQSELQTIVLERLKTLANNNDQRHAETRRHMESLSARQSECEKLLTRLSELYTLLTPLIDSINSALGSKPR